MIRKGLFHEGIQFTLMGVPYIEEDKVVTTDNSLMGGDSFIMTKEEDRFLLMCNPIRFYQVLWMFTKDINDFIQWRCDHYSKKIDKKYNLR